MFYCFFGSSTFFILCYAFMHLIIVESPTKAKTIGKFLGKAYRVEPSFGHVRDLPKSTLGIDTEHDFLPKYVVPKKAKERVKALKDAVKKADEVILASDEDREGEAIAWHLAEALKLDPKKTKRIVFHEITKEAIGKALENPRSIDTRLVDAQQARRVLDRLVGYELSPFLWSKVKYGLSAGRVQSVALRLIAERENERGKFQQETYWKIEAQLTDQKNSPTFHALLTHRNGEKLEQTKVEKLFAGNHTTKYSLLREKDEASKITADIQRAAVTVSGIEKKSTKRSPLPPFTTSTLQQSAINQLGFSSKQTMLIAQKLYEEGFITYMRTDSVNLAEQAIESIRSLITQTFGSQYVPDSTRRFKNTAKGAQEAHEAIRPTDPANTPKKLRESFDRNHFRLYELIWKRTMACQMAQALIDSTKVVFDASIDNTSYTLQTNGSTIAFDGYLAVYPEKFSENILPELQEKEVVIPQEVTMLQKETTPPPRYTEASLVKVLEERGIGRPSTYAPTISTLFDREYLARDDSKRLYPLEIGVLVNNLLTQHFSDIVNIDFTATMESSLDDVAEGKQSWQPVIESFYRPFHEHLEKKSSEVKKEDVLQKTGKPCPECGSDLIYRHGRFGKFISCMRYPECRYTEKTEEDKLLEQEIGNEPCSECGAAMTLKRGRFGAFLGCSRYPECKHIKKIQKTTGTSCPSCATGELIERKSKKGKIFYGCSRYPDCDFALWQKPTGKQCPECQSLLVFAEQGKVRCSNKECGRIFEQNPT